MLHAFRKHVTCEHSKTKWLRQMSSKITAAVTIYNIATGTYKFHL